MSAILHPIRWWKATSKADKAPILMRIFVGGYMVINGGMRFAGGMGELSDLFYFLPVPPAWLWAIIGTVGEVLCGAAILFGVMVRKACWVSIIGLAILAVWMPAGALSGMFGSFWINYMTLLFVILVNLLLAGPGALNMKHRFSGNVD
jgi:uncharacterized membrane protein YphA (DoxX/SURF4 family)